VRRALLTAFGGRSESSAEMFRGIRLRLIFWYTGVLAAALLIFGIALFVGVRNSLLEPSDRILKQDANVLAQGWQAFPPGALPPGYCVAPGFGLRNRILFACYDQRGQFVFANDPDTAPHFPIGQLARQALESGSASDIADSGGPFGQVQRYALRVTSDGVTLGVIMVGTPIQGQLDALDTILRLLLIFGALALVATSLGGLFLAERALLPARLAYARQREFIADASHELRTPLTLLRADAEVLLRGRRDLSADAIELLEDVVTEADYMGKLAENMLHLARLDAGEAPIEQEVVDLSVLAQDLMQRLGPLASERSLILSLENGAPVLTLGDHFLLEEATLILLDNAVKYNRAGGEIHVRTWAENGHAHLSVRDTGIGIASEHMPRLGERFYRVDKARSRAAGGVGLGVSIARRIADRHKGSVTLESKVGQGTIATLTLPSAR
jgi:signal transduction histidine kinase